jgi:hypothetical protein
LVSGQGASLIDALLGKKSPVDIADALPIAIEDAPPIASTHPVLSLLQSDLDPDDPLNHARSFTATAADAKHLFQVYGLGDTYAPPVTEATFALAAGLAVAPTDSSVTTPDAIGSLSPSASPVSGNVTVGAVKITAVVREYAPSGYDGHFVAQQNPDAQKDTKNFLGAALVSAADAGAPSVP